MNQVPTIAICDDDEKAHQQITELVRQYEESHHEDKFVLRHFSSAQELLDNTEMLDLLLLDIELGETFGVELVPLMKERFPGLIVIFISNHTKYYVHATRAEVFQFLSKPVDAFIFYEELDRFFRLYKQRQAMYAVENREGISSIPVVEILYIVSISHHLAVHHGTGVHQKRGKLSAEEKKLAQYGFIRCHQSYLVNARYIKSIKNYTVYLRNPYTSEVEELPISKKRWAEAKKAYHRWLLQQEAHT